SSTTIVDQTRTISLTLTSNHRVASALSVTRRCVRSNRRARHRVGPGTVVITRLLRFTGAHSLKPGNPRPRAKRSYSPSSAVGLAVRTTPGAPCTAAACIFRPSGGQHQFSSPFGPKHGTVPDMQHSGPSGLETVGPKHAGYPAG